MRFRIMPFQIGDFQVSIAKTNNKSNAFIAALDGQISDFSPTLVFSSFTFTNRLSLYLFLQAELINE